eukprot:TRINITY_DN6502_c0_g1_i1.p1 TRINITY_DN6502_c0_g1~~TRINITY_DN6502_c0_g1_i1.p1  ORF type:complete len:136 (+),score=25.48 TRINITY_DN6502_c0_g1_i1:79-486(+)
MGKKAQAKAKAKEGRSAERENELAMKLERNLLSWVNSTIFFGILGLRIMTSYAKGQVLGEILGMVCVFFSVIAAIYLIKRFRRNMNGDAVVRYDYYTAPIMVASYAVLMLVCVFYLAFTVPTAPLKSSSVLSPRR